MQSDATSKNGTKKGANKLRAYYSEFVRHCLRHYVKTLDEGKGGHPVFTSDAERANWAACYHVLKDYSEEDMDIISQIYRPGDTIADKIYLLERNAILPTFASEKIKRKQ